MLLQINIVKNKMNALKRKDAIHILFCIAMPVLALIFFDVVISYPFTPKYGKTLTKKL
jgi:hypothetical protein